ncbi:MAG: (d)CMP kinase [Methylococcales symbiont of Hymedesmia sp. n. MRB-2018]|nr:MAG: (d)CMP kinase [Methylococcales symbiont of Hymedesmia sp. n. MRB-2018]
MNIPVLTIDGPSGAGKGTVSRAIAMQLGWGYLDSGSIYRSLAIASNQQEIDITNVAKVVRVAESMMLEFECAAELNVKLNGKDITPELSAETTGNTASIIAAYPDVRAILLQKQKDFRQAPGLVADGRDMGTVVFADAEKKVFLTASAEERGKRRYKQLIEKGINANLTQLTEEIEARDQRDCERTSAPLKQAEDALYIDSSELSIDQVIQEVLGWVRFDRHLP